MPKPWRGIETISTKPINATKPKSPDVPKPWRGIETVEGAVDVVAKVSVVRTCLSPGEGLKPAPAPVRRNWGLLSGRA